MGNIYVDSQKFVREILAPADSGALGQGTIQLTRVSPGVVDPDQPWIPAEPVTTTQTIRAAVRGVDARLVGQPYAGTVLLASDRVAITETPSIDYEAGDVLAVDGVPVHVIAVENIPAAGIVCAVKFIIRG